LTSINNLSSTDTLYPGDLLPVWRVANSDTRKTSIFTLTSYLQTNLGSGLLITPTGGTASATADNLFGDLSPLRGFGAIVGDGATSNNTAVTSAEVSSFKQINVPEGIYSTTDIATGAALTKNYNGPGQIKTNDGNAVIPNWRVVSSLPTEGNHDYILTAGNGDAGGYYTSVFVSGSRFTGGGPGTPTDALSMPGGVVHGGQVLAGANDVYLNNIEQNADDNGYRASAGIFVANAIRDNADTTNNQFWFGFTAQGQGTVAGDVAFRVGALWKFGLDTTSATLDANQAAIALKQDQRIYLQSTQGSRYCSAVGTTYITANSVGIDLVHGNNPALRVTSLTTPVNYIELQGTTSGTPVQVVTRGTDTNVGFDIRPKGTGTIRLRGGTAGTAQVQVNDTGLGFFSGTPIAKPTVTGSRGGNAALQSLLTQLANLGLITDSSS